MIKCHVALEQLFVRYSPYRRLLPEVYRLSDEEIHRQTMRGVEITGNTFDEADLCGYEIVKWGFGETPDLLIMNRPDYLVVGLVTSPYDLRPPFVSGYKSLVFDCEIGQRIWVCHSVETQMSWIRRLIAHDQICHNNCGSYSARPTCNNAQLAGSRAISEGIRT